MLVDLHPNRNLIDGMIFPNDLALLKFGMGHCHHHHRGTLGFAKTSLSLGTCRIRPAQCDPGVFALFLIEGPMMSVEFALGERSLVSRKKIFKIYVLTNSSYIENKNYEKRQSNHKYNWKTYSCYRE